MTRLRRISCPALLLILATSAARAAGGDLSAAYRAADHAADAVVLVRYVLEKTGRGFAATGERSDVATVGTIVSPEGLVVVAGNIFPEDPEEQRQPARPRDFVVRLRSGRRVTATLLGRERQAGLAFLQLARDSSAAKPEAFPFVRFETTTPGPGDVVVLTELLPEKYAFAPSMRRGFISAVLTEPRHLLDVDAPIEDSGIGTPAFDDRGRAIGLVITDALGESGGALSVPLRLIGVLSRQKEPGFPMILPSSELAPLIASPPTDAATPARDRSWLGVTLQPVPRALAEYLKIPPPTGAMITSVWPASPAEKAGLSNEDVIVRFDGRPVETQSEDALPDFIDVVQRTGAGRTVKVDIAHAGRPTRSLDVTLAVAPKTAVRAKEYRNEAFGLVAQDLTLDVRMSRDWPEDMSGAIVSEMETAGWAQVGGLQRGDVIQAVNGEPVTNVDDLEARLKDAQAKKLKEVVFFVLRDPDTVFVPVKANW